MTRSMQILVGSACLAADRTYAPACFALDQLVDLTGKAAAFVTLRSRDNFSSEYRYDVTVRNNSADLFVADSLIVVLDHITNTAGQDHENLTGESLLTRMEIIGQDGTTEDGKPFFRVPQGSGPDLTPHSESLPVNRPHPEPGLCRGLHALVSRHGAKTRSTQTEIPGGGGRRSRRAEQSDHGQTHPAPDQERPDHGTKKHGSSANHERACPAKPASAPGHDRTISSPIVGSREAYLHDDQFFPGWTVLVLKRHATELFHLSRDERSSLMEEVVRGRRLPRPRVAGGEDQL